MRLFLSQTPEGRHVGILDY